MLYFRHSELVNTYHVSLKTVHNWIDASKRGKLDLELHEHNGRTYIANKPGNLPKLQKLSEQGKKYRNARFHKVVHPTKKFYETYDKRQILDIISNLTIHKEIPRKYNYFDGGAEYWDLWVQRLAQETSPSMLTSSIYLINNSLKSIDAALAGYDKVNVIDLGVGNALPVKDLLTHLLDRNVLHRYIALDISQPMLDIAEKNIEAWFGDKVKYEGYIKDFDHERFDDLVVDDKLNDADGKIINLVLLVGMTTVNFRSTLDALKVIYGSMSEDDILLYTCKPDTSAARQYFDFGISSDNSELSPKYRPILDLLNIDSSLYDVENGFNEQKRMRYVRVRLKTAITIKFEFGRTYRNVTVEKGDAILLMRVWHQTATEVIAEFEEAGFLLLHSTMTKDREGFLSISGIDTRTDFARP